MRRKILAAIVASIVLLIALIGAAIWSLPPQFLPEPIYRLKFGHLYPSTRAVGDGTLSDVGPAAGIDRYVVDLGLLSNDEQIETSFVLSNLPPVEMNIGFDVIGEPSSGSLLFEKPSIGWVNLEVARTSGERVIVEEGELSDWIWSGPLHIKNYAFVYKYDATTSTIEPRLSERGRGTIFTPNPTDSYRISIRAKWKPTTPEQYKIRLRLKGGGWQS